MADKEVRKKFLCPNCLKVCEGIYVGEHQVKNCSNWKCSKCGELYLAGKPKDKKEE